MWIVQVTKTKFGHKLNSKKYEFQTKREAEEFKKEQQTNTEIYYSEWRKV
jgi:hypothetical protein